jgi:hypothetical protein
VLNPRLLVLALIGSTAGFAQQGENPKSLESPITLPVAFTRSISADNSKAGDTVEARTIQRVLLPEEGQIPSGSRVIGHVTEAHGFVYDKTPYAKQKVSILTVHFDSVEVEGRALRLNVTVRAIATPLVVADAQAPPPSDMDPLGTRTQIGGDLLVPSQAEVRNMDGDVVAYNKRDGVHAHLIASGSCDGSEVEVSVAVFSASACGAYGFGNVAVTDRGSAANPSTLTLVSTHGSPKIWKHSMALLEVLPQTQALVEAVK